MYLRQAIKFQGVQRPPRCHPPWFQTSPSSRSRLQIPRSRKETIRARVAGFVKKKKKKWKEKKEKEKQQGRSVTVHCTQLHISAFRRFRDLISSLVCISDQKYRHGARQNFYSEWRPQQRVENRTVPFGGRFAERCLLAFKEGGKGSRWGWATTCVFFFSSSFERQEILRRGKILRG